MTPTSHFGALDGLRGYLALWVAIGHGLILAGYHSLKPPLHVLIRGESAVFVFMILSGFVITHLLVEKRESYLPFIFRRFMRLYPAYLVGLVAGYLVLGMWADIVTSVPWKDLARWPQYMASVQELASETYNNTAPHLALHAAMLHGVVPNEVLARAPMTFLPAAWSISLEWQFYLVAPLILVALKDRRILISGIIFFAVMHFLYFEGAFGTFSSNSFLLRSSNYFAIGIGSRLAFPYLSNLNANPLYVAVASIIVISVAAPKPLPLYVWAVFFSYFLWSRNGAFSGKIFNAVFNSQIPTFLGRISYSVYLLHRPIQVALAAAVMGHIEVDRPLALGVQLVAVAATIPVALVLHKLVEQPGMEIGRAVADWLSRRRRITPRMTSASELPR
jgi:peptidoglycan/LPS O-acetylase OafA/YrhL